MRKWEFQLLSISAISGVIDSNPKVAKAPSNGAMYLSALRSALEYRDKSNSNMPLLSIGIEASSSKTASITLLVVRRSRWLAILRLAAVGGAMADSAKL